MRYKIDSGESIRVNQVLSSNDFGLLSEYVEGFDVVAIDEAQEIDLIVEKDGKLKAYEFKWKKDAGRLPNDFKKEVRSHRISDSQPKKLFGIPSIGIISIELY